MNDVRFAIRSLRKTPTLALAVILTLAVCIGATTAVFSVVYAVLFRPLPFADPQGILLVREIWKRHTRARCRSATGPTRSARTGCSSISCR